MVSHPFDGKMSKGWGTGRFREGKSIFFPGLRIETWGTQHSGDLGGVNLEGRFGFGAVEGKCEVIGGILEAVEVELDERVIALPEERFYQRESLRGEMSSLAGGASQELGFEETFAPLIGGIGIDDDATAYAHGALVAVKRESADSYVEDGLGFREEADGARIDASWLALKLR
jgi:hypothetical protein